MARVTPEDRKDLEEHISEYDAAGRDVAVSYHLPRHEFSKLLDTKHEKYTALFNFVISLANRERD